MFDFSKQEDPDEREDLGESEHAQFLLLDAPIR